MGSGRAQFPAYRAPGTSAKPPMTSMMKGGAPPGTSRLMTGQLGGSGEARPMTSVSGAGYKGSSVGKNPGAFDPLNIGKGPAPPLAEKSDNSPEDKAKEMEKKVHRLIEESADAVVTRDMTRALEKVHFSHPTTNPAHLDGMCIFQCFYTSHIKELSLNCS